MQAGYKTIGIINFDSHTWQFPLSSIDTEPSHVPSHSAHSEEADGALFSKISITAWDETISQVYSGPTERLEVEPKLAAR